MARSRNPKQKKSTSPPASTNTSQLTTAATIVITTAPETASICASDLVTASELEPTSAPAFEPASEPVATKPSKKRSKKDASITSTPISTTTPATSSSTRATEKTVPLPKKTRTYGRKSASPAGKWDTPPANDSADGENGCTSSESVTSTTAVARLTPGPIRGWNHATPESMAAAQGCSSRGKSRNSKGKSTTPPVSTATADVMYTATNQNATIAGTIAGTTDTAADTTRGTTGDGTNSPTPEFDLDATETDPYLIETDSNSGSDYTPGSGQNQTSLPRHPTRPLRTFCRQQFQIINNISNNFSHDDIGMVGMDYPPNTDPTAGVMFPSVGPTLYSFPPHVWSSRFEDPSSRKRGPDVKELIYPRMGTFPPTLRPTSDFSSSSSSPAVTSVPFLSLTSSNLSSQPAPKKPRRNTRTNLISATTNTTTPAAATGAGQSSGRVGSSASATPTNGRGRGTASAAGAGTVRQTANARTTRNTPKSARRYRTGLAGGTTAQGNGHTVATVSNNVGPGHSGQGQGHGNGNGNGGAMDVDDGNSSGSSSTNSNVRDNSDNTFRYRDGLIRRVGNQPIIAYSHTARPGITPAEIGASLSLELIRRREEAQRLREEEEQREEEERRRNIEEVRSRRTQQAQQRPPSGTPTGQQKSSSSSVPTSPSTQYTLTPVQQTPPPRQNPQQYPRNQNMLPQSTASSGNPGQNLPSQLSQYHAPIHQPGCHTQYQEPLQHYHQSSYSSHHHQSSQQYQPSQYQRPLQLPQYPQNPGPQNHHQQFNVHHSSSHQSFTHPYSSFNGYHNYKDYGFSGNYNGNHINYDQQYSNYNNQNYQLNNSHRNQQYNSYNNYNNWNNNSYNNIASSSSSSSSSSTSGTVFAYPSQPYSSSRPCQGSLDHGPHPHPSSRRHIPFPPQLPDTLLANAHSHCYSTNTGFLMLTSPAPQPLARPIVSRNPGSPTQHQFPEYDQMTRASQAAFATLPPIRASAVQGPQFQASSNHGPTPVPVPMPFSHPSSSSSSSGHSGNMQQQQQQDSARDGQSENHESGNDADDESSSGSA